MSIVGILKANAKIQEELFLEFEQALGQDKISVAKTISIHLRDRDRVKKVIHERARELYDLLVVEINQRTEFKQLCLETDFLSVSQYEKMCMLLNVFPFNHYTLVFRSICSLIQ